MISEFIDDEYYDDEAMKQTTASTFEMMIS